MTVNNLPLPASFVQFVEGIRDHPLRQSWQLIEPVDAYGHPWEAALDFYTDEETIARETAVLPHKYGLPPGRHPPAIDPTLELWAKQPGYIPYIEEFSRILCFGRDASGDEFCLDFRESLQEPSVVVWDCAYWRRVAPSFERFIALIEPFGEYEYEDLGPEDGAEETGASEA